MSSVVLDAKDFKLELSAKTFKNNPAMNNTLLHVNVYSDGFSGMMDMDLGIDDLQKFIKQIHDMNTKVKGSAKIQEPLGQKNYISMEIDKTGHVIVRGVISVLPHELHFENKFELSYLDQFDKALSEL